MLKTKLVSIDENLNKSSHLFALYCIVYCKNRVRSNKKQVPFVNTWKHSQACSWKTEKTLGLSSRYSQKLAR